MALVKGISGRWPVISDQQSNWVRPLVGLGYLVPQRAEGFSQVKLTGIDTMLVYSS